MKIIKTNGTGKFMPNKNKTTTTLSLFFKNCFLKCDSEIPGFLKMIKNIDS
jgi:hypothetical protein